MLSSPPLLSPLGARSGLSVILSPFLLLMSIQGTAAPSGRLSDAGESIHFAVSKRQRVLLKSLPEDLVVLAPSSKPFDSLRGLRAKQVGSWAADDAALETILSAFGGMKDASAVRFLSAGTFSFSDHSALRVFVTDEANAAAILAKGASRLRFMTKDEIADEEANVILVHSDGPNSSPLKIFPGAEFIPAESDRQQKVSGRMTWVFSSDADFEEVKRYYNELLGKDDIRNKHDDLYLIITPDMELRIEKKPSRRVLVTIIERENVIISHTLKQTRRIRAGQKGYRSRNQSGHIIRYSRPLKTPRIYKDKKSGSREAVCQGCTK